MRSPGHKHGKLNMIRIGSAYPRFRKGIAVTRAVTFVIVILLLTLAVVGILGMIFVAFSGGTPYQLLPTLLTAVITALIWTGIIYLASELICGALEVLVDLGDQTLDQSIDRDVAERSQLDHSGELQPPVAVPAPMAPVAVVSSPFIVPSEPAARRVSPRDMDEPQLDPPGRSAESDDSVANRLLEVAQKHIRNGNKTEAVRCLREIANRYGATTAAAAARRALGWVT